jgi:hypothetical protein
MPIRHTALALLGLAIIVATPSSAQTRVDQTCLVGGQRGQGVTQIATNCPIGRTPALSSFRFGFFNGDHRLRQATLMPNGETFEASWADSNTDDPYFIEARWLRIPEATGGIVTAVVQGDAAIPIPRGPANTTLVLSGFEFKRADGTDNNIRTIAIETDSANSRIRTVMIDDQGADFTNLGLAIAAGFAFGALGVPDPNMSFGATDVALSLLNRSGGPPLVPGRPVYESLPAETPAPTPAASGGTIPLIMPVTPSAMLRVPQPEVKVNSTSARPYRVRVAYLWVPNNRLARTRGVSGGGRRPGPPDTSGTLPGEAPHVLHAFMFSFDNSDHFIGGMGVHLNGRAPVQNINNEVVTWEDANRDDPIRWSARFSELVDAPVYRAVTPATARVTTMAPVTTTAPTTPPAESSTPPASEEEETPAERRARRRAERRGE